MRPRVFQPLSLFRSAQNSVERQIFSANSSTLMLSPIKLKLNSGYNFQYIYSKDLRSRELRWNTIVSTLPLPECIKDRMKIVL